ncbi:MAG: DUF2283 domain-containing protein [Nanoarchaeota archaeon]|nr:DUF2283 domain-containing protein [Nanoarchaeota archaeon]
MKQETNTYDIYYDKEADFLEIFFGEPSKSNAEEIEEGVFVRRDENTNEVKSIGILSFKKRAGVLKEILKRVNMDFPLEISV